jgi:hypothetical protein
MAKKFLTPIDLNNLELLNARLQNLAVAPSHSIGRIYYDTALGYARVSTGTVWIDIIQGATDTEAVQDIVGALLSGTEVVPTYTDASGTLVLSIGSGVITNTHISGSAAISADKTADGTTNKVYTATEKTKLSGIATGATANSPDATLLARANHTGTQSADTLTDGTTNKAFLATERTKLTGIATGATANSADATLLARANHTGTQTADTITDGTTNKAYTATEQTKLAGIAAGATNYTDTNARANRLDQFAAPTAAVAFNGQRITGLADPTGAQDAATKAYVDGLAAGLDPKGSVRAATTAAGTLATSFANGQVIDGVTLVTGNRILIKNQSAGAENGIYVVAASGAPVRATDADSNAEVTAGMFVFVEEGTVNADTGWVLNNNGTVTLGTTALSFTQFSGAGAYTAGAGLTQTGTTFDVVGGTGISVAADAVAIDTTVVSRKTAFAVGDGAATSYLLTHNFNNRDVIVQVYLNSGTFEEVEVDVQRTSVNTITVIFATAPAASAYRAVVQG